MWIAKGTLLALWLFGFGTMALLYFSIYRHLPPNCQGIDLNQSEPGRKPTALGFVVACTTS
jgi:hypothetical protein